LDSMRKAGYLFAEGVSVLPVLNETGELVGSLYKEDFIHFQNDYFENLEFGDRGNEFLMEEDSSIRFIPIDQISRYMTPSIEQISIDSDVDNAQKILSQNEKSAALVTDGNEIIGSISMLDIAVGKRKAVAACCQQCKNEKPTTELHSL